MPGADEKPVSSFETELAELESVVKELETGELPLERALELFERGMSLSLRCRQQLEEAETRVEILIQKSNRFQAEPFSLPNGPAGHRPSEPPPEEE